MDHDSLNKFYDSMSNQRWRVHYERLITRAIGRKVDGYVERHHIIPKCLGGSNDESNLVELTAEEHYVAHQLLIKCIPGNRKIAYAVMLMTSTSPDLKRSPNKSYKWLRELRSENMKGFEHSEETRLKMSEWRKGKSFGPHSEETRLKISESNKGRVVSDKVRIAVAEANRTRVITEESKIKRKLSMGEYKHSEETKAKIGAAHRGRVYGPLADSTKRKLSEVMTGRKMSEESRVKLSESLKNRILSEEAKEKISNAVAEANRRRVVSEETRAKMSASRTGIFPSEETKAKRRASMLATCQRKREEKERLLKEGAENA